MIPLALFCCSLVRLCCLLFFPCHLSLQCLLHFKHFFALIFLLHKIRRVKFSFRTIALDEPKFVSWIHIFRRIAKNSYEIGRDSDEIAHCASPITNSGKLALSIAKIVLCEHFHHPLISKGLTLQKPFSFRSLLAGTRFLDYF